MNSSGLRPSFNSLAFLNPNEYDVNIVKGEYGPQNDVKSGAQHQDEVR